LTSGTRSRRSGQSSNAFPDTPRSHSAGSALGHQTRRSVSLRAVTACRHRGSYPLSRPSTARIHRSSWSQLAKIRLTTNLLVFTTTGNRSHGRPQTGIEPDSRPRLERTRSLTLPGVADATAAAMRSTCLRLHVLVNAAGIEIVGRCDRPTECSATSHSHHDLLPITLLPIT
jgi:hypothetical protein